jgi:upstream activation factor subunit UAF30
MPRKSKKQEVEEVEPEEVEQTSEAEEAPAKKSKRSRSKKDKKSKKEKKAKKSKSKSRKSKKAEAEAEAEAEPEVAAEVEAPAAEEKSKTEAKAEVKAPSETAELETLQTETNAMFKEVLESVGEKRDVVKVILTAVRNLQRQVNKERKETAKVVKKLQKGQRKKRRGGNKAPGGFTKPTPLSEPMCGFLTVESGTELPRTEVTRRINQYVKDHNLQNPENKKIILPDANLKKLLYLSDDDELTYFNLQSFMKIHFLKRDSATGVVADFAPPTVEATA